MKPWELTSRLWCILQSIYEEASPELAALKMNPRSFFLLARVDELNNPAKLAEVLFLPAPTVTFIVKQLEEAGYLDRTTDRRDLRRYHLSVSNAGKDALEKGRECVGRIAKKRMGNLTRDEISTLGDIMHKLELP